LYHELTHRHLHTVIRPTVHDRIDGWHVYRTLFDILIEEFDSMASSSSDTPVVDGEGGQGGIEKGSPSSTPPPLYILPEWAFDILHEFVYQFQGFCQFRINTMVQANKFTMSSNWSTTATPSGNTSTGANTTATASSSVDGNTSTESSTGTINPTTTSEDTPVVSEGENGTAAVTVAPSAGAPTVTTKKHPSAHLVETIRVLNENKDAWAIETVLYYLHRLISMGSGNGLVTHSTTTSSSPKKNKLKPMNAAMQYLGVFASVTLSRLECLLGDHTACLDALIPLTVSSYHSQFSGMIFPPTMGITTATTSTMPSTTTTTAAADEVIIPSLMVTLKPSTPEELISSVMAARISMSYHAGVSFLMLRRYKDAIRTLSSTCAFMQRGLFKSVGYTPPTNSAQQQHPLVGSSAAGAATTPTPSSLPPSATVMYRKNLPVGFDQLVKMYDRMVTLLAILSHICSIRRPNPMDESVQRVVLDRHGHQLARIETSEERYEDLFLSACPKFILAGVPQYDTAFTGGVVVHAAQDAIKLQVKHFIKEVASAAINRKLRSYMKLYTSISVEKLGRLVSEDNFLSSLLACKYKMYQIETIDGAYGDDDHDGLGMAMDTHFFIHDNVIHIDEEEKQNRFENFFISQITQNQEILRDVQKI